MKSNVQGIGMTSQRTRERLLDRLRGQGISDLRVLEAIRSVPRHIFIEEALSSRAYEDSALPIGYAQTISQPFIVALMTQALLAGGPVRRVLEIGTGCGYQSAVLAAVVDDVFTIERIEPLFKDARRRLTKLGLRNVRFLLGDGSNGWAEHAPYDGIIVTAAPATVPQKLLDQLAPEGRLVIPVGGPTMQELRLIRRTNGEYTDERLELVNFVPLVVGS